MWAVSLRKALPHLLRSIADRQARATPPEVSHGELIEVIDGLKSRIGELEERVDFAERLLAAHRDAARLAPPQHLG